MKGEFILFSCIILLMHYCLLYSNLVDYQESCSAPQLDIVRIFGFNLAKISSFADLEQNVKVGEVWSWKPPLPDSRFLLRSSALMMTSAFSSLNCQFSSLGLLPHAFPSSACLWKFSDYYIQSKMDLCSSALISGKQPALKHLECKGLTQRRGFSAFTRTL